MKSGGLLREARRRAGLSQAELGRRVGRPQTQIARWERGAVLPSLETLQRLVRACGLDLTLGLAVRDDSYAVEARGRLLLSPTARLERAIASATAVHRLRPAPTRIGETPLDPLPVLDALEAAEVRFVLIGTLAGALRGSPLVPVDATVELVPQDDRDNLERLEATRRALGAAAPNIAIIPYPPGTFGYADLRRDAELLRVKTARARVASLADLVRIAEAAPEPERHAQVAALRATLAVAEQGHHTPVSA